MKVSELRDFILTAFETVGLEKKEFEDLLMAHCKSLKPELLKNFQFRDRKTYEIVKPSNLPKKVADGVFRYFMSIVILKTGTLNKFNQEVRGPVRLAGDKDELARKLKKLSKADLEKIVSEYKANLFITSTKSNISKLVSETGKLCRGILRELPEAVIYLTDDEKGWTLKGVFGEFYNSIYGSIPLDEPSDKTSADYYEKLGLNRRNNKAISDYYDRIGKSDF